MAAPEAAPAARLTSLDAYRGFTMLLMASHSPFLKVATRIIPTARPGNSWRFSSSTTSSGSAAPSGT